MQKPLFKLCSPCCNNCPVIERNGDVVTIHDPELPSSGQIEMPLHVLEMLLDPERGVDGVIPDAHQQTLFLNRFIRAELRMDRVDLALNHSLSRPFSFTLAEWNQLFGSHENQRLALESLRTNEPVILNPVPAAQAA